LENVDMDVNKYLQRIGVEITDVRDPDLELLKRLQLAHVFSVPYENVDIIKNIPLSLDEEALFEKIVINKRGGLCFELNTLFDKLLTNLGFETESYFPRFWRGEVGVPIPRHRVIAVKISGERYLCDVGIGSAAPRVPLLLSEGLVQEAYGESYKFMCDAQFGWMLYEYKGGEWQKYFSFTEERYNDADFVPTMFWCEKHPASKFNKGLMVSLKTPDGRISIDGNTFKIFVGSELAGIFEDLSHSKICELLRERFGMKYITEWED
jgi:N-hydroxyarylamine O-acetyltransferase